MIDRGFYGESITRSTEMTDSPMHGMMVANSGTKRKYSEGKGNTACVKYTKKWARTTRPVKKHGFTSRKLSKGGEKVKLSVSKDVQRAVIELIRRYTVTKGAKSIQPFACAVIKECYVNADVRDVEALDRNTLQSGRINKGTLVIVIASVQATTAFKGMFTPKQGCRTGSR